MLRNYFQHNLQKITTCKKYICESIQYILSKCEQKSAALPLLLPFHRSRNLCFWNPAARKHRIMCLSRRSALDVPRLGLRPRLLDVFDELNADTVAVDVDLLQVLMLLLPRPRPRPPRPPRNLYAFDLFSGRPVIVDSGGNGGSSSSDDSVPYE